MNDVAMAGATVPGSSLAAAPGFGPLAATLDRLRHRGEPGVAVRIGQPDPNGWLRCSELVRGDSRELSARLTAIGARNEVPARDIRASYLVTIHAWTVAAVGLGTFVADRRVPDLSLENVWLNRDLAATEQVVLAEGWFWCLAVDPAAAHPLAHPVATPAELLLILRGQLEDHFGAVFAALRVTKPRLGEPAMWALAADNLAAAAIAQLPGAPLAEVEALIAPFVRDPNSRFTGKTWVFALPGECRPSIWTLRHGCCLSYKLPGDDMMCPLCPLRPLPERMEALRHYLARRAEAADTANR